MKIASVLFLIVSAFSAASAFANPILRPVVHPPIVHPPVFHPPVVVRPPFRPPVVVRPPVAHLPHRGPIVTRPGHVYVPGRPVFVHPGRPVWFAPRPWYVAPRVVYRPWIINRWVRPRFYPFAISPIYMPMVAGFTLEQGELWPDNEQNLEEFVHYSFAINADSTIVLNPQHVCKVAELCNSGTYNLAPITLTYTKNIDACGIVNYLASGYTPGGDFVSLHMVDQARAFCMTAETYELGATLNYASGEIEPLSGNSTYRAF